MANKPVKKKKPLSPAMKKLVKGVKKQEANRRARTAAAYQKLDAAKKKAKPKAKPAAKPTAAQIAAIRKKPVAQRTMAEVRMLVPNAVNKLGHTRAQADRYASNAAKVNEMRAAAKAKAGKAGPVKSKPKAKPFSNAKKKPYKPY